jgi:hypothetical protein
MALVQYFAKAMLSNKRLWTFGVFQMAMWLFLIAYVFSNGATGTVTTLTPQVGVWYGYIALASVSTLAVTLVATILYSNASLAYCFRYTKLSPLSYVTNMLGSSAVLGVILSVIQLLATYLVFSSRFHLSLAPSDPAAAVGISVLAGAFMLGLGMLLALVVVNYAGMQSQGFLNFVPIMLTIVLGLSQAFVTLPASLVYASPFNAVESLLAGAYSGQAPHIQLTDPTTAVLQWQYLLASLAVWVGCLIGVDSLLLRRLKPRNIEEARPM